MFGIETNAKEEMDLSLLPVFFLNEWMRPSGRPRRYSQFIREHMLKDWYLSAIHMDKQRPFLLLEGIFF